MERHLYLDTLPIPEAVSRVRAALSREVLLPSETVPSHEALGRVLTRAVFARYSSPTFHSAAMDGIAVRAEKTFAAREDAPLVLSPDGGFVQVNTGNPLPEGMDAVIMAEHVVMQKDGGARIEAPAFPWQHVRRIGEDIVATELLLPHGRRLSAFDLAALLSAGIWEVETAGRLRMAVIPTGDEVLDYATRPVPGPGQVVESNSVMLVSMARSEGFQAERRPPVPDDPDALEAAARAALAEGFHVVVLGAGSSAGTKDYTRTVMERLGAVLVHGVAAMPGKPSLLGVAQNGAMLAGAPGYPVSAAICFEKLVLPLCAWLERRTPAERPSLPVRLARRVTSKPGLQEFVRLAVGRVGADYVGLPLARGAGLLTTLTRAQALASLPAASEGADAGETVTAELLVPREELDSTLVVVGSHDNTLDLLADELMGIPSPVRLASSHVGSMGGIMALASGQALCAGAHLFDPDTGDFNFPFLERYASSLVLAAVNLAVRHQGLIVAKGNPKKITGVADLTRPDVVFANRQRGAGTRILLDWHLKKAGIAPGEVKGYEKEEFTHMAVAVNVLTGTADCGLGIHAAAKALDLDFVPLARERYDLLVPRPALEDPRIKALLAVVRDPAFQAKVRALGGYETDFAGQEMRPGFGLGEG
ncbi:PBP domain containing protein [Desulfovibrio sp. X2]|uniref:molybdopterin biosynthesis protein n=1 Tax=Desulfovibrio sp. X2 TaxID=941449 RepID=UPI000358974C|nr:molybdopterin biosynthesis protein [Desulfovibrio sp. X2]EPR44404.1 PBP domain containing protein [Desulfovibrio sp. X2]